MKKLILLLTIIVTFFSACKKEKNITQYEDGLIPFAAKQKILADKIVSIFENDDTIIQYGYVKNLGDGRGYTAGKAGFTSADGDLLQVVQKYTALVPNNLLVPYLPTLQTLADDGSDDTTAIPNFPAAWRACTGDPKFIDAQNYVADLLYYEPAIEACTDNGLKLPASLLCIYDCCIQHGDGDDPDGLYAIIDKTNDDCGAAGEDIDELEWMMRFLYNRRKALLNPDNEETRDEWSQSVGRVDALNRILQNNLRLQNETVKVNPFGTEHIIHL
ncbi:MAG: chitosanase [Chitinophagales bacterium]